MVLCWEFKLALNLGETKVTGILNKVVPRAYVYLKFYWQKNWLTFIKVRYFVASADWPLNNFV